MMKAGDIVHLCDFPEGYFDAIIESISTHSETGYEYGEPIATVVDEDGVYIAAMMEHDFIVRGGELWERVI